MSNARHLLFPFGVEAAGAIGWALYFLGLWAVGALVPVSLPLPPELALVGGAVLVCGVLAWGFPDPDYGSETGRAVGTVTAGALVIPRVATVSLLVGFLRFGILAATVYALLAFFLAVLGGLLGRRFRAGEG